MRRSRSLLKSVRVRLSELSGLLLTLPTEAQWEYACRAGNSDEDSEIDDLDETAWSSENSACKISEVKGKKPNAWGLYDMYGNVWEWCKEWYDDRYYTIAPSSDPPGPSNGSHRVIRGGSKLTPARYCRSAFRARCLSSDQLSVLGFRPVLIPEYSEEVSQTDSVVKQMSSGANDDGGGTEETLTDINLPETFGRKMQAGEKRIITVNGIDYTFCWCPPGEFKMGSPDSEEGRDQDELQHRVRLTCGYWILESEVTQEMWESVMGSAGGKTTSSVGEGALYPMYNVDWHEAQDFCSKFSKLAGNDVVARIPTEAEWEYACRAGAAESLDGAGNLDAVCWYQENSEGKPHEIKMKEANPWGLFDMHGNVAEWCSDLKEDYSNFGETNPKGSADLFYEIHRGVRIYRGGEWRSTSKRCRTADRSGADPKYHSDGLGVRPVLVPSIEWYAQAAEEGDAEAQFCLAVCYSEGNGVVQDDAEAMNWCRKSAEQGYAEAQYLFGVCCAEGKGIVQDDAEAVKWYQNAAKQGHADAQLTLGNCYAEGKGIKQNDKKAVSWFRKAAEQGLAEAEFCLGFCYKYGKGVKINNTESKKWYQKTLEQFHPEALFGRGYVTERALLRWNHKITPIPTEAVICYRMAAELDHPKANFNLGKCYFFGRGVEQDHTKAAELFLKAAELKDAEAQNWIAKSYSDGNGIEQDDEQAIHWFLEAAKQGDIESQRILANCYMCGQAVEKDIDEARKWLREAALQGDVEAQFLLAESYKKIGEVDPEAIPWYREAAQQGLPEAQYQLGDCYAHGLGVEKNDEEAVIWYRKAAEQGNFRAQYWLGFHYSEGLGIAKDNTEAINWFKEALESNPKWTKESFQQMKDFGHAFDPEILAALGLEE